MITPIEQLGRIAPTAGAAAAPAPEGGAFSAVFHSAIETVRQTEAEKTEAQYLLATGQLDNPAALTIAATKNQIAVDLLVQLRNKSLEAYPELTRINM